MERITSKANKIIKDTKRLMSSSARRYEKSLFVLEGARLCFDVLNSDYGVKRVFITDKEYNLNRKNADRLIKRAESACFISEDVCEKLSDTKSPQGVFAVCRMKKSSEKLSGKILALDNVQNPANAGAIFRTAEAFGIETIILYNCCDLYNPKTLRASMGGVLRVSAVETDNLERTLNGLKKEYKIYSSVPDREAVNIKSVDFSGKAVCVIGNEANGVEENIKSISDALITIPMNGRAESLNAAAAAAVIMWEMVKQ